jgi:hypothetical protein
MYQVLVGINCGAFVLGMITLLVTQNPSNNLYFMMIINLLSAIFLKACIIEEKLNEKE